MGNTSPTINCFKVVVESKFQMPQGKYYKNFQSLHKLPIGQIKSNTSNQPVLNSYHHYNKFHLSSCYFK